MTEQRRLAAIVSADVAGYSRLMGRDDSETLAELKELRRNVVDPAIATHAGCIVKITGERLLLELPSVVIAVRRAVEVVAARRRWSSSFRSSSNARQTDPHCLGRPLVDFVPNPGSPNWQSRT